MKNQLLKVIHRQLKRRKSKAPKTLNHFMKKTYQWAIQQAIRQMNSPLSSAHRHQQVS